MRAIRLLSVRSYWKSYIEVAVISNSISVNTFENLRRFLYFNDNAVFENPDASGRDDCIKFIH